MPRTGIKGHKSSSSKLPDERHGKSGRSGRPGKTKSIMKPSGDGPSPSTAPKAARRGASYGGTDQSAFQASIGGPFGGQKGGKSKKERHAALPN